MNTTTFFQNWQNRNQLNELITKDSRVCEVGVREGEFYRHLASAGPKHLVGIDIWEWAEKESQNDILVSKDALVDIREAVQNWVYGRPGLQIIQGWSHRAPIYFVDYYFDLVYIDADHTYESVKADLAAWWPKVGRGGVMAGHDYDNTVLFGRIPFGVIRAVDEFSKEHNLPLHLDNDSPRNWAFVKP